MLGLTRKMAPASEWSAALGSSSFLYSAHRGVDARSLRLLLAA